MVKKWLDSIEKQRRRIDLKEALQTNKHTYRQTESTTKNSRLLAGAESTQLRSQIQCNAERRTVKTNADIDYMADSR